MDPNPTGIVYRGKGTKITVSVESVDILREFAQLVKGDIFWDFRKRYGNILGLLDIPVQEALLIVLAQYWDVTMRCFTFSNLQTAPTIEEYGEFLRMPVKKGEPVYSHPGHYPSKKAIAKLLEMDVDKVRLICPGQTEGISRDLVEDRMMSLAREENWVGFNRVLALAIYGLVLFPSTPGLIDLAALSVFHMVEHHHINPIPAILAETYLSLNLCQSKKGGKIRCCLQLLAVWIMNHLFGKAYQKERYDPYNPLGFFKDREGKIQCDRGEWIEVFKRLEEKLFFWKLSWWWDEEIIYRCGNFPNVPLMGPRGCINYNPSLLLRQWAFQQKIPSEEAVQMLQFRYDKPNAKDLSQRVREAWNHVEYKGKVELGKRMVATTDDYQTWLKARIQGINPSFASSDPLLSKDPVKSKEQLVRELGKKEAEVEKLTCEGHKREENCVQLQNEYNILRVEIDKLRKRKAIDANAELETLKKENAKLKNSVREANKYVEETEARMKNNRIRLMKAVKEMDTLQKQVMEMQPLMQLQQEVDMLTEQLEKKINELDNVRSSSTTTVQDLVDRLGQQAETIGKWKSLYKDQVAETNMWIERLHRLISLANTAVPRFSEAFEQAEAVVIPLNVAPEMSNFLCLCREVIAELRNFAKF